MIYSRDLLCGVWFRSETLTDGEILTEYANMAVDGSFEFTFIMQDKNGEVVEESVELGDWGLVGDIHFTITKGEYIDNQEYAADLSDQNNYHAYQVLQINSQIFEYKHIVSNEVFILRRVVDKIGMC